GPHDDAAVAHRQVTAFDQLHAHLLGEKGVFEISRVVHPGREHDRRVRPEAVTHSGVQAVGVIVDGHHTGLREQPRKYARADLAVLEHVGNAAWRARVVLQHVDGAVGIADQVNPGDVNPDAVRRRESAYFRPVVG